jgi:predicted metal-dependent hydrolase
VGPSDPAQRAAGEHLSADDWSALLSRDLGLPVEVRYGRARTDVVSARREPRSRMLRVRLNAMFADAPPAVQEALGAWLRSGRRARKSAAALDAWIEVRLSRLHREEPSDLALEPRGRHHDLDALARELAHGELLADLERRGGLPRITWGRVRRSRSRRALRLGSFEFASRVVRIHPVLDQAGVPQWFVRYVLFHELLHAALDEPRQGSRRVLHGPQFRSREREYVDFQRARAWETAHIDALIRSARRGVDLARPKVARKGARAWVQRTLFGDR